MATYFFADYEKKRRLWIDILLHFFLAIFGEIFAYFYTFLGVYISKKIFCVLLGLILICALLTVVVHHYLYTWNRRKLRSLINQPRLYSLSVRFQLEENCRALKLIRPGVLSHSVVIAVFGLFLGAPLLVFPHGTPTGEFILAITEAMGSLHVIAMQQVILKTVPMYNNTYKIHPNHDTVLYFQQLRAQWD
ncbi:unnamed protein product, partial [Mesorhabditis belari]|uniref:Uncharacterized protein n=1 Tax=Mesorhabditis belari TaxID=2138241 RepID=A0AAF3EMD4_9BILA